MISRRSFVAFPWFGARRVKCGGAEFERLGKGAERRHYIWIHGNERTAGEVLVAHMQAVEGRGFAVRSRQRNVLVEGLKLDPNRMFSRVGAERSLRALNPNAAPAAIERALGRLDRDRGRFLGIVLPPPDRLLVALHNNSSAYSVLSEVPISDRTALSDAANPHEFLLCTAPADYELLAKSPFNVVLQEKAPPSDDGSLSRVCAARRIRYVNIEAGLGKVDEQRKMLEWVERELPERVA